jgi:hypothetical protein
VALQQKDMLRAPSVKEMVMAKVRVVRRDHGFVEQVRALRKLEEVEAVVRRLNVDFQVHAGAIDEAGARVEEVYALVSELEEVLVLAAENALSREVQDEVDRAESEGVPPGLLASTVVDRLGESDESAGARRPWNRAVSGRPELRALSSQT